MENHHFPMVFLWCSYGVPIESAIVPVAFFCWRGAVISGQDAWRCRDKTRGDFSDCLEMGKPIGIEWYCIDQYQ